MSFFSNFYTKPGPGISSDTPEKKGIKRYFELFLRHFWDLGKTNLLYVLSSIPMFVIYYLSINFFDIFSLKTLFAENDWFNTYKVLVSYITVVIIILCGSGPASAATSYIMNCITYEKGLFVWMDFKDFFQQYFKKGIIIAVMDILLITLILPLAVRFYYVYYLNTANWIYFVMFLIIVIVFVIYIAMHIYMYPFMVTMELNLSDIFKNSLILTLVYIPQNIVIIFLTSAVTFLIFSTYNLAFAAIITLLCWISFVRYPIEYFSAKKIKKISSTNNVQN